MNLRIRKAATALLGAALACLLCGQAAAGSLTLSDQQTDGNPATGSGTVNALSVPGAYGYADIFSAPTTTIQGSPTPGYGFYDDYVFSISGATVDDITATINYASLVGISDLQVRLYNTSGNPTLPVLGAPAGGAIDSWSTMISAGPLSGTVAVVPPTNLAAGTYVLEIRGDVTGSAGGGYGGLLNLTPVPLPAALTLLLSGLGLLAAGLRRRAAA